MGTMNSTALRPLTQAERRAVDLMDIGADIDDVMGETRLGRAQIVAARDLAALWTAVARDAEKSAPTDPRPVITIDLEPCAESEPAADELDAAVGPMDRAACGEDPEPARIPTGEAGDLLERGRASGNQRARDLTATLDRYLAELAGILESDEKTRAVREEIARLEKSLAAKKAELAALLPAAAARSRAKPVFDAPFPNGAPKTVTIGGVEVDRKLYYSEAVRSWARENGHQVGVAGKMPRTAVEAYLAAHSGS
jgi:hypothetical protein